MIVNLINYHKARLISSTDGNCCDCFKESMLCEIISHANINSKTRKIAQNVASWTILERIINFFQIIQPHTIISYKIFR